MNNGRTHQRHVVRPVQETTFLHGLACAGRDGRVTTFHHAHATTVGQLVNGRFIELIDGTTGDAKIAGNVENTFGIIELCRRATDNVSSKQGTTLVLDLVDGAKLTLGNAVGFVDMATGVGKA